MIESSIITKDLKAKDTFEPFTFINWLKQNISVTPDINQQFVSYRKYVVDWTKAKKMAKEELTQTLQELYVQVLREIALTYSTEEEKRFITNANLNDQSDVDIILPFFINKLKKLCLFYSITRQTLKNTPLEYGIKGTPFGIKKIIKDVIFSTAQFDLFFDNRPCFFPPLSSIATTLSVDIEELYDLTDTYFNKSAENNEQYVSLMQNASSTNFIFPEIYLDFKQAIVNAIAQYPFYLNSLEGIFSVNPYLSGTELEYLKSRDFINYINSGAPDNLKLNLLKKLSPKFLANDFYYLSTGNTTTEIVSGLLFSVSPLSGAPTLNLLNRHYPTVAAVQSLDLLYADYEIGRFFLPQHQGILTYATPVKKYFIEKEKLKPNTVYAFPDPNIVGNVSYNNEDTSYAPVTYVIDVSWNKASRSNQYKFGDIFASSYYPQYYGYQSREEDLQITTSGISRIQDSPDFWDGLKKNIWSNSDLWPGISISENYPNTEREQSLMVNRGTPVYWGSDAFNNDFCLLKDIRSLKTLTSVPSSEGVIFGQSTIGYDPQNTTNKKSIFEKHFELPGALYYRDSITGKTQLATTGLSSVFFKYPSSILGEINLNIKYFAVYGNTFVLETSGYVIVDSFNYNAGKFISNNQTGFIRKKVVLNKNLEYFAGEWYVESENILYLCFLQLDPVEYRSNFKSLYPTIYEINLITNNSRIIYPEPAKYSSKIYSLSVNQEPPQIDLRYINGVSFEYLKHTNLFNINYLAKNLNSLPFIVNEQLTRREPFFETRAPQLFQPLYYMVDNNYFTSELSLFVKYNGSSSGTIGNHSYSEGSFFGNTSSLIGKNYLYCDGVKPLQINTTGVFIVYFDWQSYNEITVFLGCSAYTLKNTGNTVIWDAFTPQATLLKNDTVYSIEQQKNNVTVNIDILKYVDNQIKFTVTSNTPGFTGLLCDVPDSIYKEIAVTTIGDGEGRVLSDPFCIECNNKCSELFGFNTTVTFIASSDYWSTFVKWVDGPCNNTSTDCIFSVTTAVNFKAYFEKIPTRTITVNTPAGRIFSQDSRIEVSAGNGMQGPASTSVIYPVGVFITLSAVTPISGWAMFGYDGGGCNGVAIDRCTFNVTQDANIFARYIRYFEYPLRVFVVSYVQQQSAAADYIAIGGDNVYDGNSSGDPYSYRYDCNSSCTFMFTGTNTSRYKNQTATLSAKPSPGRRLKYWYGDLNCNQEEYALKSTITPYASVVIAEPTDIVNTGYICQLDMDRAREVTGVFDIGYYTLTLITSGDGLGVLFAYPEEYKNQLVPPVYYYKERTEPGDLLQFAVLSGTTITVRCTATKGSTFLNLSSIYCAQIDGVSACTFKMDHDITVINTISATEFFTLTILNKATCGVGVTAFPPGRFNISIDCGTNICQTSYAAGRRVDIQSVSAKPAQNCDIYYFLADILPAGGLQFKYQGGDGIVVSVMDDYANIGDTLSLVDSSLLIGAGGAPYASGVGITVESKAYVSMTDNITVTAFPI